MFSQPDILIARIIGIVFVASGFILGIYGLDNPQSSWLSTALGLLVTGMIAQGYALIRSFTMARQRGQGEKDP